LGSLPAEETTELACKKNGKNEIKRHMRGKEKAIPAMNSLQICHHRYQRTAYFYHSVDSAS
jgi:hypothetical protein